MVMTSKIENEFHPDLLACVLELILQHPQGLAEHQLLKNLATKGYEVFSPSLEPLALFQAHFLLFHLLYRQRENWHQQGHGWLQIDCLCIQFHPVPYEADAKTQNQLKIDDPLARYYLDFEHYRQTQTEEVVNLLENFWLRLSTNKPNQVIEAKRILNIADDQMLSIELIERQFRQLSQVHHPDRGGKKHDFQQITQARAVLKSSI